MCERHVAGLGVSITQLGIDEEGSDSALLLGIFPM